MVFPESSSPNETDQEMSVFVSGATGFIGMPLAKRLSAKGLQVHALYRSEEKAKRISGEGIRLFKGDILDHPSLMKALKGCTRAYHVAAFAGVYSDPSYIYQMNVQGTLNVIEAARQAGVERVVVTSTAGILGPSRSGLPVNESSPVPDSFFTPYESSKYLMEQEIKNVDQSDIEVVIVNPTRVYGPGLMSESNGVTVMIKKYIKNNWRFLPGNGNQSGNYVFVEDVVTGHLLAMQRGKPGERYILGGTNLSYIQLFDLVREISQITKRLYRIPFWTMITASHTMQQIARLTGRTPLIVPDLVRKFNHQWIVSSEKATREIGYSPISAREGIGITVQWINQNY
jgi:nucleoside-diphosphate-sugar epimerase